MRGLRSSRQLLDLEEAFSRIPQDFERSEAVLFRVIAKGLSSPLRPLLLTEVYRIGREALVNAFRYSGVEY